MEAQHNSPSAKRPSSLKFFILALLGVLCAAAIVWVVFINLPRPDFAVSQNLETGGANGLTNGLTNGLASGQVDDQASPQTDAPELPFNACVVYSPGYLINLGGMEKMHPFDIRKYEKIHNGLINDGLLTEEQTLKPAPLTQDDLLLIHSKEYLEDLQERKKIAEYLEAPILQYAPLKLDRAVLGPFLRASGGTLLAARQALETGIGINIGGGYHHAKPDRGEGFCLYADVPIAIRKLQSEKLIERALVIDVDVHQGNGTIVCLPDDSTFTFSMHQGDIYPTPKEIGDLDVELSGGMKDEEYLEIMAEHLPKILDESEADICFIVGGCDTLDGDPLASLKMTADGIVKRDHAIIQACEQRNMPVVLTLSGGYSPDAWKSQYMSIKNIVEAYGLSDKVSVEEEQTKKTSKKSN